MKTKLSKTQLLVMKGRMTEASFMYFNHDYIVFNLVLADTITTTRVITMGEARSLIQELSKENFDITTVIPRG